VTPARHAQQTARLMQAFEPVLLECTPDWLVVAGDVNSTLACVIVSNKTHAATSWPRAYRKSGSCSSAT